MKKCKECKVTFEDYNELKNNFSLTDCYMCKLAFFTCYPFNLAVARYAEEYKLEVLNKIFTEYKKVEGRIKE